MNDKARKLLELVKNACKATPDEIPPGWMHQRQIGEALKMRKSSVAVSIAKLLRTGAIEQRTFKVQQKARVFPRAFYRLKG